MFSHADAVERQGSGGFTDGDQAEIGRAAADVANQHDVTRAHVAAPVGAGGFQPGVKRSERFFEQEGFGKTRAAGGVAGEVARRLVKGGWNGDHHAGGGPVEFVGVIHRRAQVGKKVGGGVERGNFGGGRHGLGLPGENGRRAVDAGVAQPGFGGSHEPVGSERAATASKAADHRSILSCGPRKGERTGNLFVGMRQIQRGGQQRQRLDRAGAGSLDERNNTRRLGARDECYGRVTGAQVNAEGESAGGVHDEARMGLK